MVEIVCPNCQKTIDIEKQGINCTGKGCIAAFHEGCLTFGKGYSEAIITDHRRSLATEEQLDFRIKFEKHHATWCLETAWPYLQSREKDREISYLSLGCGVGMDVMEMLAHGYDAYGMDTAYLIPDWKAHHGEKANRLICSTDGQLPFPEGSFDLMDSMAVLEHVGTIPPEEFVTENTNDARFRYIYNAVTRLKKGGVLLISTNNRAFPFDGGHAHHYMPKTFWMMEHFGGTLTNPFSKWNFLPRESDITRICKRINQETPNKVVLSFRRDTNLFGQYPFLCQPMYYLNRILNLIPILNVEASMVTHIHAIIRREA